jgi:serine phosphatase RsbU (regulator of sigma subunit)
MNEKRKKVLNKKLISLENKNKEILDSIKYAKRIQLAILPSDKLIKAHFKNSFIIYKPKDIVAGDFYWMEYRDDKVLFAVADFTGHGVPGAIVSVVFNNGLNR